MEEELKQLEEKYNALPPDVREAMDSVEIAEKITEIGKKHALHIDQLEELSNQTSLVMLGMTPAENFTSQLSKTLNVPVDKAQLITKDINEGIFKAIRESLKKIHAKWEEMENSLKSEEESINRDALLKEIEVPAPATPVTAPPPPVVPVGVIAPAVAEPSTPSYKVFGGPPQNLPVGEPAFVPPPVPGMPAGLVGDKLSAPVLTERKETVEQTPSLAALKKADPYREAVG